LAKGLSGSLSESMHKSRCVSLMRPEGATLP